MPPGQVISDSFTAGKNTPGFLGPTGHNQMYLIEMERLYRRRFPVVGLAYRCPCAENDAPAESGLLVWENCIAIQHFAVNLLTVFKRRYPSPDHSFFLFGPRGTGKSTCPLIPIAFCPTPSVRGS
jgi:hypothetical protein